jgi:hypothetical protein
MIWAPDSTDLWAPDSTRPDPWAPDSRGRLTPGRAVGLFLAAKAAEGVSPRTTEWYRMILVRLVRATGHERVVDGLDPAELRRSSGNPPFLTGSFRFRPAGLTTDHGLHNPDRAPATSSPGFSAPNRLSGDDPFRWATVPRPTCSPRPTQRGDSR